MTGRSRHDEHDVGDPIWESERNRYRVECSCGWEETAWAEDAAKDSARAHLAAGRSRHDGADLPVQLSQPVRPPALCPVCLGKGIVPHGFYTIGPGVRPSTSAVDTGEQCRSCGGRGLV